MNLPDCEDFLYPVKTWRVLHSHYVDLLIASEPEVADWLLWLTERQVRFERFLLAAFRTCRIKVTYVVADDDSDAWLHLWGWHEDTHSWQRVASVDYEDAGLSLDYFRVTERLAVDSVLERLLEGESA